jgi:hypothetical protein
VDVLDVFVAVSLCLLAAGTGKCARASDAVLGVAVRLLLPLHVSISLHVSFSASLFLCVSASLRLCVPVPPCLCPAFIISRTESTISSSSLLAATICTHHYPPASLYPPLSTRSFAPPADPRRTRGLLHPLGRTLDQRPDARQAPRCEEGVLGRLERSNRLSYCNSGKVAGGQVAQKLTDARVHESTTPRFCLQRVTTVGDGFHGIDVSPRGRRAGFELDTVPVPLDRVLIRRALVHVLVLM